MKIGFLFPGQGSQSIGMGKEFYDEYDIVRDTYKRVQNITGIDVAKMTFERRRRSIKSNQKYSTCNINNEFSINRIIKGKWN